MSPPVTEDLPPQPSRKRRSSMLFRKSITPAVQTKKSYEAALEQYINDAKKETQEWINVTNKRRALHKTSTAKLDQIKTSPPMISVEDVQEYLSNEDKDFLARRPDYNKIVSNMDALLEKSALVANELRKRSSHIQINHFLAHSRIDAVAQDICTFNDEAPLELCPSKL